MPGDYLGLLRRLWSRHSVSRPESAPLAVSLFSGAGGSMLGQSMAGFRHVLAVEQGEHAVACLRANFPDTPLFHGDIRHLDAKRALELADVPPEGIDLLDASPPCQGFSIGGRRLPAPLDDPRNHLPWEVPRFVRTFRPRAFVVENVPGMAQGRMRPHFMNLLQALSHLGYQVRAWSLNSVHFLVPQNRSRSIIMGIREDLDIEPSPPDPQGWPMPLSMAIADLPREPLPEFGHVWMDESPEGRDTRTWRLAAATPQGGNYAGYQFRLRWDLPAPTLTTSAIQGRDRPPYLRRVHCHPLYTRTLSPREYARLASFPDRFSFPGPWFAGLSRVGEAVPPLFMYAIAAHLRGLISRRSSHVRTSQGNQRAR